MDQPSSSTTGAGSVSATRQPLLWAALALAAGTFAGTRLWRPPTWWIVAAGFLLLAAACLRTKRPLAAKLLTLAAVFAVAALTIQVRAPRASSGTSILPFAGRQQIVLIAHVIGEGRLRPSAFGGLRQALDVETEQIISDNSSIPVTAGVRLSVYGKESQRSHQFRYGERLRAVVKLHPPRNYRNPGAFDYRGYLADHGIDVLGWTKAESVELLPGFAGNRLELWRTRIHGRIVEKIHGLWPPHEAGLVDAMVIGEDAFIDRDTRTDFQRSGTYHILVVSGMNIGILAFVTFWVLRRLRVGDLNASAVTVLLCVAYAFLTDVGAPVWRATLMLTLYLGVRLLYRDRSMLNALGGAALGLLILDPRALFSASFQLTFLSVLIIAAIGIPILERTSQPFHRGLRHLDALAYDISLPPRIAQFRIDLRMLSDRMARLIGRRISQALLVSGARAGLAAFDLMFISALMQIGLALPMAFYFHRATVMGLPANLVVAPLTGVLMPGAIAAVVIAFIVPSLAKPVAWLAGVALELISGTVNWLGHLRAADVRIPTPDLPLILLSLAALATAMLLARRRTILSAVGLALLALSALCIAGIPPAPQINRGVLEVTAIDVGQGDSTLLVCPNGKTLLVDAGGPLGSSRSEFDVGEEVVSSYLWARGISRLDAVAISHAHSDHIGGMRAVLNNFRPRELWLGAMPSTPELTALLQQARDLGIAIVRRGAGDVFAFGGTEVRVLSPPRQDQPQNQARNNDSLVVRFAYGESAFLLEGDAEKKVERQLAILRPRADLLKIAHNGSATSTSEEWLQAVQPRAAFISVGVGNPFKHPRAEVLARLANAGVRTYRTDLNGAVSFYLDGRSVTPRAEVLR